MEQLRYVIVKHASKDQARYYFNENPRKGVDISASAHQSYTGEQENMKPFYTNKEEAEEACIKANAFNPTGGYAVCPVIE